MLLRTINTFLICFLIAFTAFAEESQVQLEKKLFGYVQYTKYEAPRYRAYATGAFVSYKYSKLFQPSLAVNGQTREYNGTGDTLQETNYTLGVASIINPAVYIETDASVSPDAKIGAKESYNVTPHWVRGSSDFGLRLGYSRYVDSRAGMLAPSVSHDFSDDFNAYLAFYIARTDKNLVAQQLKLSYSPFSNHRFGLSGGSGRTIEDAGVDAEFKSVGFEYTYHFSYFSLGLAQNNYWSNLRSEQSYTISLGFK